MKAKHLEWSQTWCDCSATGGLGAQRTVAHLEEFLREARQLRDEQGDCWGPISHGEFDKAIAAHKEASGKGADRMAPSDFRRIPAAGRLWLFDIYRVCEEA
eukprot:1443410-Lingulodinium_polyedra.AAC.1